MIILICCLLLAYPFIDIGYDIINTNYSNCNTLCNSDYYNKIKNNNIDIFGCYECLSDQLFTDDKINNYSNIHKQSNGHNNIENNCIMPKFMVCFYTTYYIELINNRRQDNNLYNSMYNVRLNYENNNKNKCEEDYILECFNYGYNLLFGGLIVLIIGICANKNIAV